jgi:hypothetical protein
MIGSIIDEEFLWRQSNIIASTIDCHYVLLLPIVASAVGNDTVCSDLDWKKRGCTLL